MCIALKIFYRTFAGMTLFNLEGISEMVDFPWVIPCPIPIGPRPVDNKRAHIRL
jgi:hypothetical protein